jgi:hypothetical protein
MTHIADHYIRRYQKKQSSGHAQTDFKKTFYLQYIISLLDSLTKNQEYARTTRMIIKKKSKLNDMVAKLNNYYKIL